MPDLRYATTTRRDYILSQLPRYRVDDKSGHSLRDIAWDVKQAFSLEKPPSPATIKSDLAILEERMSRGGISDEADALLTPERFPEWRAKMFRGPKGKPYETPEHQHAWFWIAASLALKIPLPGWVIDYFKDRCDVDLSEVNGWIEHQQALLTLWLLAPPRHGKSDLLRHTCIWLICRNPNIRIMWKSLNERVSMLTTAWIKRELETNQQLISMYGPFQKDGNWSDKEFIVASRTVNLASPTMVALGKSEGTLSRDADLIVVDDFVDKKSSASPTQVESDVLGLKSDVLTRRETWTPVLGIGSHQPSQTGDAYEFMRQHELELAEPDSPSKVIFVPIKAHDYNRCKVGQDIPEEEKHGPWCLLWPSMRPLWFLEAQRHDLGDALYETTYNQEARRTVIEYFKEEVVRGDYWQPHIDEDLGRFPDPPFIEGKTWGILDRERSYGQAPRCCGKNPNSLLRSLGFDPAAGTTRHAAESSLHVLAGCRWCERRHVIEAWHDRVSPERHPDTIDAFAAATRPHRVRIEVNAYQKALARDPRLRRSAAKRRYTIDEWFTDERRDDPEIGVAMLATIMDAGKFSLPYKTAMDRERSDQLIRQMLRWPLTPNDQMFSLWLAELTVGNLIDETRFEAPGKQPGYDQLPPYLQQVHTIDLSTIQEWDQ